MRLGSFNEFADTHPGLERAALVAEYGKALADNREALVAELQTSPEELHAMGVVPVQHTVELEAVS